MSGYRHQWTGFVLVHTDGRGWASFMRMDGIGRCSRVGVHVDGRGLLLFTQMDSIGCLSREWTGGVVIHTDGVCCSSSTGGCRRGWTGGSLFTRMDCVDRRRVGVDADGRGGSSFTRMDCVGCHPQVGVDVDGQGLLSFRQLDVVGRLSRKWTGLGVDADGQGLLSFTKMDGVGRLHAVGCGSWVGIDADGRVCRRSRGGTALGGFHVDATMLEDGGRSTWSTSGRRGPRGRLWVSFRWLRRRWRPGGY